MSHKIVQLGVDDEALARKSLKLKFEANTSYRLSIASVPGLTEGNPDFDKPLEFAVTHRFFCKALKTFVAYGGPEYDRFLGTEQVRTYGVAPVICWPTPPKSLPPEMQLQVMLSDFTIHLWLVPGNAYRDLRNIAQTYPLQKRDLSINCSDAQYQKITMLPMEDSMLEKLFAKRGAEAAQKAINRIIEEVRAIKNEMGKEMGRELTPAELDAALSGGVAPAAAGAGNAGAGQRRGSMMPSTADLDNLLQNMSPGK